MSIQKFLQVSLIFLVLFFCHGAVNSSSDEIKSNVAIYLVKDLVRLSKETNRFWKKSNFKLEFLPDCISSSENISLCVEDKLRDVVEGLGPQDNIILITDLKSQELLEILANKNINEQLSLLVSFRPGDLDVKKLEEHNLHPPLVILAGTTDDREIIASSNKTAFKLREKGLSVWSTWLTPYPRNINGNISISSPQVVIISSSVLSVGRKSKYQKFLIAERAWQNPLDTSEEFYTNSNHIYKKPINDGVKNVLVNFFSQTPYYLNQFPLESYSAFDVLKFLDYERSEDRNLYLTFKNKKGRYFVIDLSIYEEYKPMIVVGLDYVSNLYSLARFYETKKSYSWVAEDAPRQLFVDSLGPFLFFEKPLPENLRLPLWQYGQIMFESIEITKNNPLVSFNNLEPDLSKVLVGNCISCHEVSGIGGRAHHINAFTRELSPGFGLPLESYENKVMKNFLYNQEAVAAEIGVIPNPVSEVIAKKMLNYLYQ
ncbi:MAG: hypothetical protein ACRBDX_04815 [Gammaproteobacteria bacterium]